MPFLPDIGLGELLLIGLVALFIVGPERLPTVMEKLGLFVANLRHFIQGMTAGWGFSGNPDETPEDDMIAQKPKPKK